MKGIFMDTMTYAAFAAFRGDVAEKDNQPVLQEAEFTPLDMAQIAKHTKVLHLWRAPYSLSATGRAA
jgi:hypothetical protein